MKKKIRLGLLVLGVLLLVSQFVPADTANPPVSKDLGAPPEVDAVLRRCCYDCHSNETVWPWYAKVSPAKFLLASHVSDGREHVNFSEWDSYSEAERKHILHECEEEIEQEKMPEGAYLLLHGDAKVTPDELKVLSVWFESQ